MSLPVIFPFAIMYYWLLVTIFKLMWNHRLSPLRPNTSPTLGYVWVLSQGIQALVDTVPCTKVDDECLSIPYRNIAELLNCADNIIYINRNN